MLKDIGDYDGIIFSPGPDIPRPGNAMEQILSRYGNKIPILGICLGLQAITLFYGGKILNLNEVVHGRTRMVRQTNVKSDLFDGLPEEFPAGLYHSWIADKEYMPPELLITALSEEGRVMAIKHKSFMIEAFQFHPESIMTTHGSEMINNWLNSIKIL